VQVLAGLALLVAVVPPLEAASWQETFAADSDTVVFLGAQGQLLKAPFHFAQMETLWVPSSGERITRFLVSPDGRRVAWLTRAGDRGITTLWVGGFEPPRPLLIFAGLAPPDYGTLHYEAMIPTIEDRVVRGARWIAPNSRMRRQTSNALEWTADGSAIVVGSANGLAVAYPDSGTVWEVSKALAVSLRRLDPTTIVLAEVIRMGYQARLTILSNPLASTRQDLQRAPLDPAGEELGGLPNVLRASSPMEGEYLFYPTAGGWKVFPASGLRPGNPWTASPETIWWADGTRIRAVRAHDPAPTVEIEGHDPVVWLEYEGSSRSVVWAAGTRVSRRAEHGGPEAQVFATTSPILSVISPSQSAVRGFVTADSLLLWDPRTGSLDRFPSRGLLPSVLVQGPGGDFLLGTATRGGRAPAFYRLDAAGARLLRIEGPSIKGGRFFATPRASHLILLKPSARVPETVQVLDVAAGTWSEIRNPGITGWEPLAP
jgi:hypothetical protein